MADITSFHNFLLWIITAITAFVLVLLLIVMIRYNARANPTPSRTTHNTWLEVAWTAIPTVLFLTMFVYGWTNYGYMRSAPRNAGSLAMATASAG